jgi:hypothetical protein
MVLRTMTETLGHAAETARLSEPVPLGGRETERVRTRVRLMVEITARRGQYRSGLAAAAKRLTPSEAAIIADLEAHGLDVQQLREVLCGAHVLVDEPMLYERWRFPKSRSRLSSHHKTIDKEQFPDIGFKGPLVREKLHGRTAAGTWIQLEKTPAEAGGCLRFPSMSDVWHLFDYLVYRATRRNVGPWGLSGVTERRPMYLSPDLGVTMPLPAAAEAELTGALERIEEEDDVTSASADLAARFPPPDRASTLAEIVFVPGARSGRGLFGSSDVWITETPSPPARELLIREHEAPVWRLPPAPRAERATLELGEREVAYAVRRMRPGEEDET